MALAALRCPMKFPHEAKAWQTQQRRANGRKDGLRRSEGPLTCGEHTGDERSKWDVMRGSDECLCVCRVIAEQRSVLPHSCTCTPLTFDE